MNTNDLMVAVEMITYNHESYIAQAIESVVNQKTNFKYKLIICEDCSTDKTQQICTEYKNKFPDKIELHLNEKNIGVSLNAKKLHEASFNSNAKYIAMCDGDDYWTDPNKLQKQVDFLEANPEYSICWTKYGVLNLNGDLHYENWPDFFKGKEQLEVNLNNFFNPYATHTLTTVFKKEVFNPTAIAKMKYSKDYTIFCMCLSNGKGAVLDFCSAVYRHGNGTFSCLPAFNQCYSNYQALREIVKKVPDCNTEHLKKFRDKQLYNSFALSIFNKEVSLKKNFSLYLKVLIHNTMLEKMRATRTMIKQLYGMRKRSWKASPANVI